jgi:hypothetical protein
LRWYVSRRQSRIRADSDNHSAELASICETGDLAVLTAVLVAVLVGQMLTSHVADDVIVTVACCLRLNTVRVLDTVIVLGCTRVKV